MADAAISFAVEKLGDALLHKIDFLKGVEKQVRWVKDELQSMRCFLKDADKRQGHDEGVRKWISDVREVAQDAEDVIDIFTLKVINAPTRKRDLLRNWAAHISHLNTVGKEIESIRTTLEEIGKRRDRYGIRNLGMEPSSSSRRKSEMVELRRRMAVRFQRDKDVVGLDADADLLLKKVIMDEERKGLSLAAIVGMGGIGKSTLARKIYNHPAIAARFKKRVWVVISSEFEAEDIMKEIMQQLPFSVQDVDEYEADESKQQEMLKKLRLEHDERLNEVESIQGKLRRQEMFQQILRKRLEGKRYFIVLDDVWEHTHWEVLKYAFPDEQGKASRLLFTSRKEIFRKHQGYIHKMKELKADESWELLLETAFINRREGIRCPQELEDIGRKIVEKCHGLPLAITVAGGLLANEEESRSGWDRVWRQMKNYHSETSEIGRNVSAVLELSYHNLPSQLKPCFLCLAFFKEDAVIRAKRLRHIWVALGFVQEDGEETVEERARIYLDELVNRNLIQVKKMTIDDRVKYCSVHDLLRELSIKKANEEIGFTGLTREDVGCSLSSHKPRHRGIGKRPIQIDKWDENKHLRSLFLNVEGPDDDSYFSTPSYWESFGLLRILDIEGSGLQRLPSRIRALIGIRYLRLREAKAELRLPRWLDVLKNLEIVDIADCWLVTFPDVTWKMESLRHFYIDSECSKFSDSMKKSSWKNLETFKYVSADSLLSDDPIQVFSQRLLKLGIHVTKEGMEGVGRILVDTVQVLHLRWTYVTDDTYFPIPNSPNHLTKLKLYGPLNSFPSADKFPSITHLTLAQTRITRNHGPMQELGKLPNLLVLKLVDALSYTMSTINVSHKGFPRLKVLHLTSLQWLENIEIKQGGMPELQRLQLLRCPCLSNNKDLRERIRPAEIIIMPN